jgi:hypothetical protein
MATLKYFAQKTKDGYPIPSTMMGFKTAPTADTLVEILPQDYAALPGQSIIAPDSGLRYFVRRKANGQIIPNSLITSLKKPKGLVYEFKLVKGTANTPPIPVAYNFDVDSSNWAAAGITNQASFQSVTGAVCSSFVLSGNNIKAVIEHVPGGYLQLLNCNITNVKYIKNVNNSELNQIFSINLSNNSNININNLEFPLADTISVLSLAGCDLLEFKTNQQLPTSLRELYLRLNNFYNPLWDNSMLNWATFQNQFQMLGLPSRGLVIDFLQGYGDLYPIGSPIKTMFDSKNIVEYYM